MTDWTETMTASIVGPNTRASYADLGIELKDMPIEGDSFVPAQRRTPGQLWERLQDRTNMDSNHAKSVVLSDAYTFQVAHAFSVVNRESMERIANGEGRDRAVRELYRLHPHAHRTGAWAVGLGSRTRYPNGAPECASHEHGYDDATGERYCID